MMQVAPAAGLFQVLFLLFFGGGAGVPLGVPPEKEDPMLARIAPQECLYYTTWAGMAAPDPKSGNQTEQLLAEPEVQALVARIEALVRKGLLDGAAGTGDPNALVAAEAAPKLLRTLITRPAALFVSDVRPRADGADVFAALVVNCGDKSAETRELVQRFEEMAVADAKVVAEEVEIGGKTFHRLRLPAPTAPPVTWGMHGNYLIVGVGKDTVEGVLERAKTDPPEWLVAARKQVSVPRTSAFAYANVKAIRELVLPLLPDREVWAYLAAAGLGNVDSYVSISGLDETGFVSRTLVGIDGEARGLFTLADAEPLTASDLKIVPRDSAVAVALRLDPDKVYESVLSMVREADPRAADRMEGGVEGLRGAMGIDLRDDVLKALGDTWYLYSDPDAGGFITGWTVAVKVRNRMKLQELHEKLLAMAAASLPPGDRGPKIKHTSLEGHDIYYLSAGERGMPFAPAWCITNDYLVAGLYPQTVTAFLGRGKKFRSLGEAPEVAQVFKGEHGPLLVSYVDIPQVFEPVYSLVQIAAQAVISEVQRSGVNVDITLLPSAASIKKHLRPSVTEVQRTKAGIEIVTRQTIPGGNVGTSVPVLAALLLPAIQSAREAARRTASMNNLRQIGLGVHNFADTIGALPAAYNIDMEGKPLLSWRVHILPYIEEAELYRRFRLNEPWDSEHNRKLIPLMPNVFRSPSSEAEPGKTVYLGVRAEHSVLAPPADREKGREVPRGVRFGDVVDGTSNTILVVEASDAKAVEWTRPDDFTPAMRDPLEGLLGQRRGGFSALFTDGSVRMIPPSIDRDTIRNLFKRDDGNPVRLP